MTGGYQSCIPCFDCAKEWNRQNKIKQIRPCPESFHDCGPCLPGFSNNGRQTIGCTPLEGDDNWTMQGTTAFSSIPENIQAKLAITKVKEIENESNYVLEQEKDGTYSWLLLVFVLVLVIGVLCIAAVVFVWCCANRLFSKGNSNSSQVSSDNDTLMNANWNTRRDGFEEDSHVSEKDGTLDDTPLSTYSSASGSVESLNTGVRVRSLSTSPGSTPRPCK